MGFFSVQRFKRDFRRFADKTRFINVVFPIAQRQFLREKRRLLNAFDNHPVTIELKSGAEDAFDTPNVSNSLRGVGGSGKPGSPNLFSFIGFDEGEDPTVSIRNVLQHRLSIKKTSRRAQYRALYLVYQFPITIPSSSEINKVAAMPFESTGRSWVEAVETGTVPGINSYLYGNDSPRSHSGGGLQAKTRNGRKLQQLRVARMSSTPYITPLLQRFTSSFSAR